MSADQQKFLPTKDAATLVGRSSDYISRLAREGKISGKRIGKIWLVDRDSLFAHFDIQESAKKIEKEKLSEARKAEYKKHHKPELVVRRKFELMLDKIPADGALALAAAILIVFGGYTLTHATGLARVPGHVIDAIHENALAVHRTLVTATKMPPRAESTYVVEENDPVVIENVFADVLSGVEAFGSRFEYRGVQSNYVVTYTPQAPQLPNGKDLWEGYQAIGYDVIELAQGSVLGYTNFVKDLGVQSYKNVALAQGLARKFSSAVMGAYTDSVLVFVAATQEAPAQYTKLVYGFVDTSFEVANTLAAVPYHTGDLIVRSWQEVPEVAVAVGSTARETGPSLSDAFFAGYERFVYEFVDSSHRLADTYLGAIESAGERIGTSFAYVHLGMPSDVAAAVNSSLNAASRVAYVGISKAGEYIADAVLVPPAKFVIATADGLNQVIAESTSELAVRTQTQAAAVEERVENTRANVLSSIVGEVQKVFNYLFGKRDDPVLLVNPGPAQTTVVEEEQETTTTIVQRRPTSVTQNFYTTTDVTKGYVDSTLSALHAALSAEIQNLTRANREQIVQNIQTTQIINRLDNIHGTVIEDGEFLSGIIRDSEITGSTFTGSRVQSSEFVGGTGSFATTTVSGGLTVTGDSSVGGSLTVSGLLTTGPLTAPYFTATSTTATSTFAGGFAIDTDGFVYATSTRNVGIGVLSPAALLAIKNSTSTQPIFTLANDGGTEVIRFTNSGRLGIGTTSPYEALSVDGNGIFTGSLTAATSSFATTTLSGPLSGTTATFTSGTTTNATSTNLYSENLVAGTSTLTNIVGTNATVTNATSTNFYSSIVRGVTGIFTNFRATNATTTNATTTNAYIGDLDADDATITDLVATNATSTNLFATNASTTNATSTNFFSVNGVVNELTGTNATITSATTTNFFSTLARVTTGFFTNLTATDAVITNSTTTNATSTNLYTGDLDADTATITDLVGTNATITSATTTNFYTNLLRGVTGVFTNFTVTNSTTTNATTTNLTISSLTNGSVPFIGANGKVSQDNANFFWDDANNRLGVGTATPATSFDVFGTDAIRIPVGTSAQRPSTSLAGQIRYNTDTTQYEGYNGSDWLGLGGVIDIDQDTYITAEESPDEDFLRFYTAGSQRMVISNTGNVGIGTTSPYARLSVVGQAVAEYFTATSTSISSVFPLLSSTYATSTQFAVGSLTAGRVPYATTGGRLIDSSALTFDGTTLTGTDAVFTRATTTNATSTNLGVSGNLRLPNLTASRLLSLNSSGVVTNTDIASWIAGTSEQITVTDDGDGTVTLSLPSELSFTDFTATNGTTTNATSTNLAVSGAARFTYLTQGSVPFIGSNGLLTQDNSNFFWDNTNNRLGLGTASPVAALEISGGDILLSNGQDLLWRNSSNATTSVLELSGDTTFVRGGGGAPTLRIDNSTGTNLMTFLEGGNVGIGDTTPAYLLTVGNGDVFGVNSSGAIAAATGITSSGTINFSGLTGNRLVATDGSSNLVNTITAANLLSSVTGTTGSGDLVFSASPTFTGTATFANYVATNGTTTNATSTNLAVSGGVTFSGLTGLLASNGSSGVVARSLTAPAAGLTIANANGTGGNPTFALANDLAALEGLSGTGIAVRSGADTWVQRSITGTANQITVTNGDGVSGNPVLSLPSLVALTDFTATNGTTTNATSTNLHVSGSLTVPSDSFGTAEIEDVYLLNTGDTATGDYNFDSGTFFVDSVNNRVGVGTTSPQYQLHNWGNSVSQVNTMVENYSTGGAAHLFRTNNTATRYIGVEGASPYKLHIGAGATAGSNAWMTFDGSGNVGIGTTTPNSELFVFAAATPEIRTGWTTTSSYGQNSFWESGSRIGVLQGIGSAFATADRQSDIELIADTGDISFWPGLAQTVTFKSGGNVGIGTSAPGYQLSLQTPSGYSNKTNLYVDGGGSGGAVIELNRNSPTSWQALVNFSTAGTNYWKTGLLNDATNNYYIADGASNKFVTVVDNGTAGNVGIGTTSPQTTLHLGVGAIRLDRVSQTSFIGYGDANGNSVTNVDATDFYVSGGDNNDFIIASRANSANEGIKFGNTSGGTFTEHMLIDGTTGNVGIGTTSPDTLLDVYSNTGSTEIQASEGGGATTMIRSTDSTGQFGTRTSHPLLLTTGFTERMRIDTSGNVGIGTTGPADKLDVAGSIRLSNDVRYTSSDFRIYGTTASGSDNARASLSGSGSLTTSRGAYVIATGNQHADAGKLALASGSGGGGVDVIATTGDLRLTAGTDVIVNAGGTERMRINSSGNVGIGTAGPGHKLTVEGSGDSNTGVLGIDVTGSGSFKWASAAIAPSLATGNNIIHMIGQAESTKNAGYIGFNYQGAGSNNNFLTFGLFANDNIMNITGAGNVGIGTASPEQKLHIQGAGPLLLQNSTPILTLRASNTSTSRIYFGDTDADLRGGFFYDHSADSLATWTAGAERMRITSAGNVGIGTATPNRVLQVQGEIAVDGLTGGHGQFRMIRDNTTPAVIHRNDGSNYYMLLTAAGDEWGSWNTLRPFNIAVATGDVNIGNSALYVEHAGNVGIGTTNPVNKFVVANSGAEGIELIPATSAGVNRLQSYNRGDSTYDTLQLNALDYRFLNSGTEVVRIDSSGNVGIGTALPGNLLDVVHATDAKLAVRATTGGGKMIVRAFQGSLGQFGSENNIPIELITNNTARLHIDTSGNVGIGTTGPSYPLEIYDSSDSRVAIRADEETGDIYALNFLAGTGAAAAGNVVGSIVGRINQVSPSVLKSEMQFYVNTGDTITRAMTINNAGNVGIGTTGPGQKLTVEQAGQNHALQLQTTSGAGNYTGLSLHGGSGAWSLAGMRAVDAGSYNGDLVFLTDGDNTNNVNLTEKVRITSAGNVGIGTTNPNDGKVEVKGGTVCVDTNSDDSATSCIASESDERLKENVVVVSGALATLQELRGVQFDWKVNDAEVLSHYPLISRFSEQPRSYGLIAQEVQGVLPEVVSLETVGDSEVQYLQLDYEKFIPFLIEGVKELDTRTSGITVTDIDGNIGIGTSTPEYKVHVLGDVAATSFVNISTREQKKGVAYLDEARKDDILAKLQTVQIAEYRYEYESENNPLRLGLIAEEAPSEILSVSGKGVDIYKMATFTLGAVQQLATRVESLEERVAALEAGGVSTGGGVFSTSTLQSALSELGVLIEKGFAQFDKLAFRQLIAAPAEDGTRAAGTGVVLAGNKLVLVENPQIKSSSKVFVTFTSPVVGSWYITDKASGSFRVTLDQVQGSDVSFDYFIVQTERDKKTVSDSGVVDTEAPVITLSGANPYYISVGTAYTEPGVTITDNVDSDLGYELFVDGYPEADRPLDTSVAGEHVLTYRAVDTAGNVSTEIRSVVVGDGANLESSDTSVGSSTPVVEETATTTEEVATTTPVVEEGPVAEEPIDDVAPVVKLNGKATMKVDQGGVYEEQGATATDDVDGDISSNVEITGLVDVSVPDLYELTYSVSDAAGNTGSASRLIEVVEVVEETATSTPESGV